MLRRLWLMLRSLFLRARVEREMRQEILQHIEEATARNLARGMTPVDAAHAAHREFGNVDYMRELGRDARGARWIDAVKGDARFALRHFRRTSLPTATMVLVLALGIGVNVVLFAVFHSIWTLPGAAIPHDAALVRIRGSALTPLVGDLRARSMSYPEVHAYAQQGNLFAGVAASIPAAGVLSTADPQRPAGVAGLSYVSDSYFDLLNVQPLLGTTWRPTPLTAGHADALVALIGYRTWQIVFAGRPDVIGRTVRLNDVAVTVIGVMPRGFSGTDQNAYLNRVWLPLPAYPLVEKSSAYAFASPDSALFHTIARLQPGVAAQAATPVVKAIAQRALAARTHQPDATIGSADVKPLLASNANPGDDDELRLAALGFGALTLLILLVTCTNVSSLLAGMAVARRREVAVRLSLGAERRRIIGQLLTESVLLALMASALAVFVIWLVITVLDARYPDELLAEQILIDWRATVVACGIALATGIVFGLSPALHATRLALTDVLKDAGSAQSGSRSSLHRALVVTQIALTQPLLVGVVAAIMSATADVRNLRRSPLDEHLVEMSFDMFVDHNIPLPNQSSGVLDAISHRLDQLTVVRERLAALPGVVGVTPDDWGRYRPLVVHPADKAGELATDTILVRARFAMPGYLQLRDMHILRGRDFNASELTPVAGAAIIGDGLARMLFGAADPIGRRILMPRDSVAKTIVGIVDDDHPELAPRSSNETPQVFLVGSARGFMTGSLLVRTHGPGDAMVAELRTAAVEAVPQLRVLRASTLAQQYDNNRSELLAIAAALSAGGFVALFLSAIALYAVIAFAVNQRTREIGIRSALGARPRRIAAMFLASGIRLSMLGLIFGLPISLLALEFFRSQLSLPRSEIPSVGMLVGAGVLLIAGIATWLPARRAAGVDPLSALRAE